MLGSDLVALGEIEAGLEELREAPACPVGEPSSSAVVTGYNLALNLLATDHLEEALEVPPARRRPRARRARAALRDGARGPRQRHPAAARPLGRRRSGDRGRARARPAPPRDAVSRGRPVAARRPSRQRSATPSPARDDRPDATRAGSRGGPRDRRRPRRPCSAGRPDAALDAVDRGMAAHRVRRSVWSDAARRARVPGGRGTRGRLRRTRTSRVSPSSWRGPPRCAPGSRSCAAAPWPPSGLAWLAAAEADAARLDQRSDADVVDAGRRGLGSGRAIRTSSPRSASGLAESELRRSGVKADVGADLTAAWATASRLRAAA